MADTVKLDNKGLNSLVPQVKKLNNRVEKSSRSIERSMKELDMQLASRAGMENEINDAIKVLGTQKEAMHNIAGVFEEGARLADEATSWLEKLIDAIKNIILGVVGAVVNIVGGNNNGNDSTEIVDPISPKPPVEPVTPDSDDSGDKKDNENVDDKKDSDETKDDGTKNTNFETRKSSPSLDSKYYDKKNPYASIKNGEIKPNCTWYAYGRAHEIMGDEWETRINGKNLGNAECWYENLQDCGFEVGQEPRPGAIAVWSGPGKAPGHVAIVEEVTDKGTVFSESSLGGVWYRNKEMAEDCTKWATSPAMYNYYGNADEYWGSALYTDLNNLYQPTGEVDANRNAIKVKMEFLGYVYLD